MSKTEMQSFTFPRPISPQKDPLKPNAHPYPIKTTSSALLSRSNSSPQHQSHHSNSNYHYVPISPSPSPTYPKTRPSPSHQYSRSLTEVPRPLPVPPSPSNQAENVPLPRLPPPRRSKRADTLPTQPVPAAQSLPFSLEDLPPNPKSWTPSQLSAYLSNALRVKSGETLEIPAVVARDIAGFVRDSKINGKSFLRFSESDLESYGINQLWRTALLNASRNLRQNVVKGRIWGFGNTLDDSPHSPSSSPPLKEEDEDSTPNNHHRRRSTSYSSNPFVNGTAFYSSASSSSSMEDLSHSDTGSPTVHHKLGGRYKNGRVKGMVETFERSASFDEGQPESVRERSGSVHSIRSANSSGSSGFEEESNGSMYRTARQLPIPPSFMSPRADAESGEEELSMAELLASSPSKFPLPPSPSPGKYNGSTGKKKRRGVHAWEAEDGGGIITVKRLATGSNGRSAENASGTGPRGVGEIFDIPTEEAQSKVDVAVATDLDPVGDRLAAHTETVNTAEGSTVEREMEARMKQEVESTRILLEEFNKRLVHVEQKIEDMEAQHQERERQELERQKPRENAMEVPANVPQAFYGKVLATLFGSSRPSDGEPKASPYTKFLDPRTISALPPYLLLVSIGVCAIVFKVVLRRTIGVAIAKRK